MIKTPGGKADHERVETTFGEIAVARGFLTMEQLAECQFARRKLREKGQESRLGEVMIARGLITKSQGLEILKAAHQALGHRRRIGGYELVHKLGEGAMGAVYEAQQLSMDRTVALKLLPRALSRDKDAIERFLREARIVAGLSHPNIVRGFEVGEANGYHYFAMEFVDGGTVTDRLNAQGALPEEEVIDVGLQVAEALQHAHEHGVIHRDVKPDNIMVASGGIVKIADLGLATRLQAANITQSGDAVGTPYYMAPEQAEGKSDVDGRADIYALGGTLYHLVTGRPPFDGASAPAIMSKRLVEDPTPACSVRPSVSREFTAVLMKMMGRRPADRYATCEELAADLRLLLAGEAPACLELVRDVAGPGRRRRESWRRIAARLPSAGREGAGAERAKPFALPALPTWATAGRLWAAAGLLLLAAGATWLGFHWGRLMGPRHPRRPAVRWDRPPSPPPPAGNQAREAWRAAREYLAGHMDDPQGQIEALRSFIQRHPESPYAAHARRLLLDLGAAEGLDEDATARAP